jgi:hypothetical protein
MACPISVQERLRGWRRRSLPFSRRPCADSRVQLTGGRTGHSSGRGGVLSPRASTASGMALQCAGWLHRADGDGGDAPRWSDVTAWSWASAEQASVPRSRVPPSSFEGVARQSYESGCHSVTELTLALPHSTVQWRGWPHREGWRNSIGI